MPMALLKIFYLLFILSCASTPLFETSAANLSCSSLKKLFEIRGLDKSVVPSNSKPGKGAGHICPKVDANTCCAFNVEQNFKRLSQGDLRRLLDRKINPTKNIFGQKAKQLDIADPVNIFKAYFQNITVAKEHNMLVGEDLTDLYKQVHNRSREFRYDIHMYLNYELWRYLDGEEDHNYLSKETKTFFRNLITGTYKLLDPRAADDSSNAHSLFLCVVTVIPYLPFGDVPRKFTNKVVKTFRAARAFVHGMDVGYNTLIAMNSIMNNVTNQCQINLVKTSYCSWCLRNSGLKPCQDNCLRVYRGCFQESLQFFSPQWDDYIAALLEMIEVLEGPSGFEAVINHMDVDLSDAVEIMQHQYNTILKDKIADKCRGYRKKRSPPFPSKYYFLEMTKKRVKRDIGSGTTPNLERLFATFKVQVNASKGMWSRMADSICTEVSAVSGDCWNGTSIITSKTIETQQILNKSEETPSQGIDEQIPKAIKVLLSKLRSATLALQLRLANYSREADDSDDANGSGSNSNNNGRGYSGSGRGYSGSGCGGSGCGYSGGGSDGEATTDSPRTLLAIIPASHTSGNLSGSFAIEESDAYEQNVTERGLKQNLTDVNLKHNSSDVRNISHSLSVSLHPHTWLILLSLLLEQMSVLFKGTLV